MPEITITEDQREYLDALRESLAAEHAGEYAHVRPRDAIQYLIDSHGPPEDRESSAEPTGSDASSGDDEEEGDDPGGTAEDRLSAMMSLLETHDDKWRQIDSEEGRYEVDLPEDESAVVRTKDDVRATLFEHYG